MQASHDAVLLICPSALPCSPAHARCAELRGMVVLAGAGWLQCAGSGTVSRIPDGVFLSDHAARGLRRHVRAHWMTAVPGSSLERLSGPDINLIP